MNRPPPPADEMRSLRIGGMVDAAFDVSVDDLAGMTRKEITADFHCVAGWSHRDLRWEGVSFRSFYEDTIAPRIKPGVRVTHLLLSAADGYAATLLLEDACADDVLLADRLGGAPLTPGHGAPLRLLSPSQYGYKSVKHLIAIELHTSEPRERHARLLMEIGLSAVRAHPRGRVALEERHRHLPAWAVRWSYRNVIHPFIGLRSRLPRRNG
jgi:DMSO/TMAO reductase YedYZ molybdopterin-dependent catalytic subunit